MEFLICFLAQVAMRSLLSVVAAQRFFQPALPARAPGLARETRVPLRAIAQAGGAEQESTPPPVLNISMESYQELSMDASIDIDQGSNQEGNIASKLTGLLLHR